MSEAVVRIREWFGRHHADRCRCRNGPPDHWAVYFAELLAMLDDWQSRAHQRYEENVLLIAENQRLRRQVENHVDGS